MNTGAKAAPESFIKTFAHKAVPGSAILLENVSWDDYEGYLKEIGDDYHLRLSYDNGRLEIMSPAFEHENLAGAFPHLIFVLADECGMKCIGARSTTMRKKPKSKGLEPDDCYYFKNYQAILGKKKIDLLIDPPPDLALEIDITSPSLKKLGIYAAIGVPELWRYRKQCLQFFRLVNEDYVEISHSDLFPFLTPDVMVSYLRQGSLTDLVELANNFRTWVKENRSTTKSK
jgi:Uma2 family endonuclease